MYDVFEKYAYSIEEFERCNYDSAVRTWIDIFSSDTTDEYREEIINNIYSCFVLLVGNFCPIQGEDSCTSIGQIFPSGGEESCTPSGRCRNMRLALFQP